MKNLQTFVIALPLLIVSSLASAVSVSGNVALTSDYIWRGWTQSAGGPAVSGGFDYLQTADFTLVLGVQVFSLVTLLLAILLKWNLMFTLGTVLTLQTISL